MDLLTVNDITPPFGARHPAKTATYTKAVNQGIPSPGTLTSPLVATAAGKVLDLDVTANITHPNVADLTASLIAPDGTRVVLFAGIGRGANFTDTVLDDEAATPIASGTAPFTGRFRPAGNLALLEGKGLAGSWTMAITDGSKKNRGQLVGWSITARYTPGA